MVNPVIYENHVNGIKNYGYVWSNFRLKYECWAMRAENEVKATEIRLLL